MNKRDIRPSGWNFAFVPKDVFLSKELTHADVRLYCYLLWRSGTKDNSWPGVETMAGDTGMSYAAVKLSLRSLIENNWIRRERQFKGSSVTWIYETQDACRSANRLAHVRLTGEPSISQQDSRLKESKLKRVKEREKTLREKPPRPPSPVYELALSLSEVCKMDLGANKGMLVREAKSLLSASPPATPELVRQHYNGNPSAFWKAHDWRGKKGQPPTPAQVRQTWGQWESVSPPEPKGFAAVRDFLGAQHGND